MNETITALARTDANQRLNSLAEFAIPSFSGVQGDGNYGFEPTISTPAWRRRARRILARRLCSQKTLRNINSLICRRRISPR